LGLDVVVDEIAEPLTAVELGATTPGCRTAEQAKLHRLSLSYRIIRLRHCRRQARDRLVPGGLPLRHGLSRPFPSEPVADRISHHQLQVTPLEPGQLFREHRHALPVRARHAGDIGAPEAALRAEGVNDLPDILVDVTMGIGLARIARRAGELYRDV